VSAGYSRVARFTNSASITLSFFAVLQTPESGGRLIVHGVTDSVRALLSGAFWLSVATARRSVTGTRVRIIADTYSRVTIIVRAIDGHKYKIKSNAILSLGVDLGVDQENEPFHAELESKANLTDVTDPLNPISLGGNLLLQLRMTDNGEPGENDTISFTLWDGGTLLFSSNWDGAQSVEEAVARGNLQVHP